MNSGKAIEISCLMYRLSTRLRPSLTLQKESGAMIRALYWHDGSKFGIIEPSKKDAETIAFTRSRQRGQGNQTTSHLSRQPSSGLKFKVSQMRRKKLKWLTQISLPQGRLLKFSVSQRSGLE